MTRYVWKPGEGFCHRSTGEPMALPERDDVCAPMVRSDISEYRSPIDGSLISSRSHRREDLKRNDCVEVPPRDKPRGYRNERFAAKHSLPLNHELAAEHRAKTKATAKAVEEARKPADV